MKRRLVTQAEQEAYVKRIQTGPCFICKIVSGDPDEQHHLIYQDGRAIVFLNRYPTLYGYVIVAPCEHRQQVTGDFREDEYLQLQQLIYRVAEAVRAEVHPERVYILSLGSQQGNSHVHWHIAPLPLGVPFEDQQLKVLSSDFGILELSAEEKAALAGNIRRRIVDSRIVDSRIAEMNVA